MAGLNKAAPSGSIICVNKMDYSYFAGLPPQLGTFLIAMVPVGELRAAIPFALTVYKMPVFESYVFSVAGNMFPVLFLLAGLDAVSGFLIRHSAAARSFFSWLFTRTRSRFTGPYQKWGSLALVLFVAVPLPVTGAWTGSAAAYLFGIPRKKAFLLILCGVMIAGVIVTLLTQGLSILF